MMLLDFLLSHLLDKTWAAIVETDDLNSQTWVDGAHLAPFLHLRKEPQHICGLVILLLLSSLTKRMGLIPHIMYLN